MLDAALSWDMDIGMIARLLGERSLTWRTGGGAGGVSSEVLRIVIDPPISSSSRGHDVWQSVGLPDGGVPWRKRRRSVLISSSGGVEDLLVLDGVVGHQPDRDRDVAARVRLLQRLQLSPSAAVFSCRPQGYLGP